MADELKPCPFCGHNKAELRDGSYGAIGRDKGARIVCRNSPCDMSLGPFSDDREAISKWNRRATPEPGEAIKAATEALEMADRQLQQCGADVEGYAITQIRAAIAALRAAKEKDNG